MSQWRYSLNANKLTAAKQIAERVYSLAQIQNDPALMMGACHALAATLYFLGNFEDARKHAMRGVQIWRSGDGQSPVEDVETAAVTCLCYQALSEWHFGEIASSQATLAEAMSLAKELNDMHGLAVTLCYAAGLSYVERNPAEVERLASDLDHQMANPKFVGRSFGGASRGIATAAGRTQRRFTRALSPPGCCAPYRSGIARRH